MWNDSDIDGDALSAELLSTIPSSAGVLSFDIEDSTFVYAPAPNFHGATSFTYRPSDGKLYGEPTSVTLVVLAANDAPVNTVPDSLAMMLNGALNLSTANGNPVSVNDIDAGIASMEVALSATNGTVTLGNLAGLTFLTGDGVDDVTMTFSAPLSTVQAALDTLRYVPYHGFIGSGSITITTNDLGNTGSGGPRSDTDSVSIAVKDADGIDDSVDTLPLAFSNVFSDGTTTGTITSRGDQIVTIVDAANPADGVLITADSLGGAAPAAITVDGATLNLDPGESVVVTHGSVILNVVAGVIEATFTTESGQIVATASLAAGTDFTFDPETVTFAVAPISEAPSVEIVLIGKHGQEATAALLPGNKISFEPEAFTFTAPETNTEPVEVVTDSVEFEVFPGETVVAGVQAVTVNILPDSLNLDSNGMLTVIVFGAVNFNAAQIDVSTVRFANASAWQSNLIDADHDGRQDLQLKFRRQDTILDQIYASLLIDDRDADGILDSTRQIAEVEVTGQTLDDALFSGSDRINLFFSGRTLRNLLEDLFG